MRTMTLLAGAVTLAIGATLAGVELVQSRQLGAGGDAIGKGTETPGRVDVSMAEDQLGVAPAAIGNCVTNRTAFRTQTNLVSTTSTTFVTMPNTHFPVTTSGGCLVVDFSGQVTSNNQEFTSFIRASIAGVGVAEPPDVFLGRPVAPSVVEVRSMRFVFPNVPAGQHVVRIEFMSMANTTTYAWKRTLTVQYRP